MSLSSSAPPGAAAPPPHPNLAAQDFPAWLPAMLVKELRQGLRTRGFVGAFFAFQIIMALVTVFAVAGGVGSGAFDMLQGSYWAMLMLLLLLVTPIRALAGLRAELDSRAVDLMLLTRLTAWRIVVGKWGSLLVQAALVVIALLPYGVARYFFGSVDLVQELGGIAAAFVGCAVITAAALWASGLPIVARVGLGLLIFFGAQFVPAGLMFFLGGRSGAIASSPSMWQWPAFFFGAVLVVICLVGAVRRLAPPADNHAPLLRVLPLAALLPIPFVDAASLEMFAVMGAALTIFVAVLELARAEEPLRIHWKNATRRKGLRLFARFVQPGWTSAFEWLLLLGAVFCLFCLPLPKPERAMRQVLLGLEALVLPVLVLSALSPRHPMRVAGYVLILAGGSLISLVAVGTGAALNVAAADAVLHVLPIAGFWMGSRNSEPAGIVLFLQIGVALAILALTWWRAAKYRALRRQFAAELAS